MHNGLGGNNFNYSRKIRKNVFSSNRGRLNKFGSVKKRSVQLNINVDRRPLISKDCAFNKKVFFVKKKTKKMSGSENCFFSKSRLFFQISTTFF